MAIASFLILVGTFSFNDRTSLAIICSSMKQAFQMLVIISTHYLNHIDYTIKYSNNFYANSSLCLLGNFHLSNVN